MHVRILSIFLIAISVISGCTGVVETQVTRFHEGGFPQGKTYTLVPSAPAQAGPEFQSYAAMIDEQMRSYGYQPADGDPDLRVHVSYEVSEGRTEIQTHPGYDPPYYGYIHPNDAPFEQHLFHPMYYGGFYGPVINSETVYTRRLELEVFDVDTAKTVFEGRAISEGQVSELAEVMPYLIDSMFRGFPGQNGRTTVVRIKTQGGGIY